MIVFSVRAGSKLREVNVDKFEQIIQGMNDEAEAVRGHALIELAKCIRKRDRCILEAVERHSELMDLIMSKSYELCGFVGDERLHKVLLMKDGAYRYL